MPRNPADRPATERLRDWLLKRDRPDHHGNDLLTDALAEAAQGAAPTPLWAAGMLAVLTRLLADPHGCRFCDYGVLRNDDKGHDPGCVWTQAPVIVRDARAALGGAEGAAPRAEGLDELARMTTHSGPHWNGNYCPLCHELDVQRLRRCPSLMALLNRYGGFNEAWWDRLAEEYGALSRPSDERVPESEERA